MAFYTVDADVGPTYEVSKIGKTQQSKQCKTLRGSPGPLTEDVKNVFTKSVRKGVTYNLFTD